MKQDSLLFVKLLTETERGNGEGGGFVTVAVACTGTCGMHTAIAETARGPEKYKIKNKMEIKRQQRAAGFNSGTMTEI